MSIAELYKIYLDCGGIVTTDSRAIAGGEIFFALKGENFDGNEYAVKALEAGAAYAVVDRTSSAACFKAGSVEDARTRDNEGRSRIIPVDDTLKTLQELARWHRSMTFVDGKPLTVIGLTGTNGKTTTKELIKAVLSVKYNVTATEGNLNNSIGVPLTLLKINSWTQIAVVEMGASHPGDIKELVSVALPNYGLITNVGKAHLLGFGSFEGVKQTKGELYDYIQRTADRVFLNVDNPDLCGMAAQRPDLLKIPYGLEYQGAVVLPSSEDNPYLRIALKDSGPEHIINTRLIGAYNADNVMAAIAVGIEFGIGLEDAIDAVSRYVPSNNRSQMVVTSSNSLIVDAYNANPTSMEAALRNFSSVKASKKSVMLGNMLELGEDSVCEHIRIIEILTEVDGLEYSVLVGDEFRKALEATDGVVRRSDGVYSAGDMEIRWFPDPSSAAEHLQKAPLEGFSILVKGSRGSRMETVVPVL